MERTIVFATKNEGKLKEIRAIMADISCTVVSMAEAGLDTDVVEDGNTFEANALKKAVEIASVCGKIVLSDDSGLEIDYLDKAPGVLSARFMGEDTPYPIKNAAILEKLAGVPEAARTARFVSVIAAAIPTNNGIETLTARGTIEGIIGYEIAGENGFGYDPIFFVPEHGMTTAEMPAALKNEISHRGKALRAMKELLAERLPQ